MTRGLTLEEQERRAYASGDPSAPLLAQALDGDDAPQDHVEWLELQQREAENRLADAESRLADAEKKISVARAALNGDRVVTP
jgi:hypothetical protein